MERATTQVGRETLAIRLLRRARRPPRCDAQRPAKPPRFATCDPQILAASLPQYSYFVRIVIQSHENTHQATHSQQQTVDRTQFVDAVRVEAAEAAVIAKQRTESIPSTLVDARMPVERLVVDLHHRKGPDTSLLSPNDQPPRSPSRQWRERQHKWAGRRSPSISCDARDVHHAAMRKAQQSRHELRLATRNPQILAASLPKYSYLVRIVIQSHENTHQATHSQQQTVDRTQFVDAVRVEAAQAAVIAEQRTEWQPPTLVDARMPVVRPVVDLHHRKRSDTSLLSPNDQPPRSPSPQWRERQHKWAGRRSPSVSCDARDVHHAAMRNAQQSRHDLRLATRKYSPPVYHSTRISSE